MSSIVEGGMWCCSVGIYFLNSILTDSPDLQVWFRAYLNVDPLSEAGDWTGAVAIPADVIRIDMKYMYHTNMDMGLPKSAPPSTAHAHVSSKG